MDTLPIEVHGSVPGSSPAQTLARVPNGTNDAAYAQRPGGAQSLATTRRIVLYIGGDTLPTNGTYCTASPVLRIASIASGKVMVATALCDGSRLVTTARREVAPKEVTANTMAHTLNRVKSFLLYGLSSSRAQPALKYTCTNDRADDC